MLVRGYRRIRFGSPIVVVSGLPRSGTSMTMRMLAAGGMNLVTDGVRSADTDNPRGYFEDERVKDLGTMQDKEWLRNARGKAIKVISFLLRELPPGHNYKVLFMGRDVEEVLASQRRMLERRGEPNHTSDEKMKQAYEDHLWRVRYLMKHDPRFDALFLRYREVLADPRGEARRIHGFLDHPLDVEEMAGAVDASLYRNRRQGA